MPASAELPGESTPPRTTWRDLARLVRLPVAASVVGDAAVGLLLVRPDAPIAWFVLLACASVAIYLAGMALNDVFDAAVDRAKAPDRPIPSGAVSTTVATRVALALTVVGVFLAALVSIQAAWCALALVAAVLAYDGWLKRWAWPGVIAMGVCRGLDVALGVGAASPIDVPWDWALLTPALVACAVHTLYTMGVTAVSLLEDVDEVKRRVLRFRVSLMTLPVFAIPAFVPGSWIAASLPLALLVATTFAPFRGMPKRVDVGTVKATVGRGVRGLLLVCAAWAWGAGFWTLGAGLIVLHAWRSRPRR